jgi:hypothetical protein
VAPPSAGSSGSARLFEDFVGGAVSWNTSGNVNSVQQGGNLFLRFAPGPSPAEASRDGGTGSLSGYTAIELRINLNGATLSGDNAVVFVDQNGAPRAAPLAPHVAQGSTEWQTIRVPLSSFGGLDQGSFSRLGFRFSGPGGAAIDVDDIRFVP